MSAAVDYTISGVMVARLGGGRFRVTWPGGRMSTLSKRELESYGLSAPPEPVGVWVELDPADAAAAREAFPPGSLAIEHVGRVRKAVADAIRAADEPVEPTPTPGTLDEVAALLAPIYQAHGWTFVGASGPNGTPTVEDMRWLVTELLARLQRFRGTEKARVYVERDDNRATVYLRVGTVPR